MSLLFAIINLQLAYYYCIFHAKSSMNHQIVS